MHLPDAWGYVVFADESGKLPSTNAPVWRDSTQQARQALDAASLCDECALFPVIVRMKCCLEDLILRQSCVSTMLSDTTKSRMASYRGKDTSTPHEETWYVGTTLHPTHTTTVNYAVPSPNPRLFLTALVS
eukprot:5284216-Amphidinium_carterae.1